MSKLWCVMGRAGDTISILPLLYSDFQHTGERQRVMVAREFASVLDGCSYIEPVIYEGDFLELAKAVEQARGLSDDVVVLSIHGATDAVKELAYKQVGASHRVTTSFQLEPWKLAGRLNDFYENLPLVFDKRSPGREDFLLRANGFKVRARRKPVILLALGGVNCPFPYADLLRELVVAKFSADYRVIDLPMVEQPDGRIYDLLAIYENSALLITTDSMPLHLAWACPKLPVFALTNDRNPKGEPSLWHGSVWRPNHLWYCRYHDWPERAVEMCAAIDLINEIESDANFVQVWGTFGFGPHYIPVVKGMVSRESEKSFHYIRDVIRMGIQRAFNDETAVQIVRPGTIGKLRVANPWTFDALPNPYFSYRTQKGQHVPIVDLFSAPKEFWKRILPEIPDMVLDNDDAQWSQALWAVFRKHGAVNQTGCCEFVGESK